ncbi:MAG: hypothetical protein WB566_18130, partial [Terriglobales bacterium]
CMTALASLGWGQSAQSTPATPTTPTVTPPRIKAAEAKNHIGEMATVCGKVVDSRKIGKYGLGGYGKPVTFDLDQPETNSVFYFVTFGVLPEGSHHGPAAPSTAAQPNTATPANGAPSGANAPPAAPAAAAPPAAGAPPVAGASPAPAKLTGPEEVIAALKDKNVCVTGKINGTAATGPFILQPDRSQIKIQEENK